MSKTTRLAAALLCLGLSAATPASQKIATESGCVACHAVDRKLVGPSYQDIAAKYQGRADAVAYLSKRVREGGPGNWGPIPMTPNDAGRLNDAKLKAVIHWILKSPH
jgi:cytochrome c